MMRWLKFNLVGVMGMGIQLGSLALLVHVLGLHYLLATALAVEAAVLHNFLWHRRWTWADRKEVQSGSPVAMLLRFNLTNGLVSIAGNLLFMRVLAGAAGLEPVAANLLSIALCSLANFLLADRFVFVPTAFRVRGDKTQRGLHRCSGKSPRVTKRPFAISGAGKARMQCVQGKEKPADFPL